MEAWDNRACYLVASAPVARNEEGCSRRPVGRRMRFPQGNGYNPLRRFPPVFASFGMAGIGTVQEGAD